jgi:hypothetical protein
MFIKHDHQNIELFVIVVVPAVRYPEDPIENSGGETKLYSPHPHHSRGASHHATKNNSTADRCHFSHPSVVGILFVAVVIASGESSGSSARKSVPLRRQI